MPKLARMCARTSIIIYRYKHTDSLSLSLNFLMNTYLSAILHLSFSYYRFVAFVTRFMVQFCLNSLKRTELNKVHNVTYKFSVKVTFYIIDTIQCHKYINVGESYYYYYYYYY